MSGPTNPNFRKAADRVCVQCGAVYQSYNKTRRYCSKACYRQSPAFADDRARIGNRAPGPRFRLRQPPRQRQRGLTRRRRGDSVWLRICKSCALPFKTTDRTKKTCSPACLTRDRADRQRGAQSHLWAGGKTAATAKVRNSAEYGTWRDLVFVRDDYTCHLCRCRGGSLTAHHIKPFSTHPDRALDVTNGVTLCWPCHASIRHRESEYEARFFQATAYALVKAG